MSPDTVVPPSAHQALIGAFQIVVGMVLTAWTVRPMLRDPRFPRWTSVVIVVSAPQLAMVGLREMISHQEYHVGLREGGWIFFWVPLALSAYCMALLWGNHLIPLKVAHPLASIVPPDVLAVVKNENDRQQRVIDDAVAQPVAAVGPNTKKAAAARKKTTSKKKASPVRH